jgi:hypothetical protein
MRHVFAHASASAALAALLAFVAVRADAQTTIRRPAKDSPGASAADPSRTVKVSLTIGGQRWDGAMVGQCKHAPTASIYDTPAAMWLVQASERGGAHPRSLSLTMWRIKETGADQMNFSASIGAARHDISTIEGVRRRPAPEVVGSGTVRMESRGAGGVFTIDGTTGSGARVQGTLECARFGGIYAEGG